MGQIHSRNNRTTLRSMPPKTSPKPSSKQSPHQSPQQTPKVNPRAGAAGGGDGGSAACGRVSPTKDVSQSQEFMKAHVTIVLDVSASMNVDRRLEIAKNAIKTLLNSTMRPGDSVSIVTFDNTVTTLLDRCVKCARVSFSMQMWAATHGPC